jgi:hypothetical protein
MRKENPMRMQIFVREDLATVLSELAWRENRWPKQQAEWLLQKALEQVVKDRLSQPVEVLRAEQEDHAPSTV